jgi:hypothetical protein
MLHGEHGSTNSARTNAGLRTMLFHERSRRRANSTVWLPCPDPSRSKSRPMVTFLHTESVGGPRRHG